MSLLHSSLSKLVFGLFTGVAPPHGNAGRAEACAVEAPACMDWFRPSLRSISCVRQPSSVGILCHIDGAFTECWSIVAVCDPKGYEQLGESGLTVR